MTSLPAAHGVIAVLLLAALVFVEETGVPLPMLPGDALLLGAGVLVANHAVDARALIPALIGASISGALVGYSWARAIGGRGLDAIARRLHAERVINRAADRLKAAGAGGVVVSRLFIPGMRVYVSLVAGATGMRLRSFVLGMVPAAVIWVVGFTLLGILVGAPAERVLHSAQSVILNAAVLLAVSVGMYVAIRHIPPSVDRVNPLLLAAPRWRRLAAVGLDMVVVAGVVLGVIELATAVFGLGTPDGVVDAAAIVAAIALGYVVLARRGAGGATAGERLFNVSHHARRRPAEG